MPIREECKNYQSRTYSTGEVARACASLVLHQRLPGVAQTTVRRMHVVSQMWVGPTAVSSNRPLRKSRRAKTSANSLTRRMTSSTRSSIRHATRCKQARGRGTLQRWASSLSAIESQKRVMTLSDSRFTEEASRALGGPTWWIEHRAAALVDSPRSHLRPSARRRLAIRTYRRVRYLRIRARCCWPRACVDHVRRCRAALCRRCR